MSAKRRSKTPNESSEQALKTELKQVKDVYLMYCKQTVSDPVWLKRIDQAIQMNTVPEALIFKNDQVTSNQMESIVSAVCRRTFVKRVEVLSTPLSLVTLQKMNRLFSSASSATIQHLKLVNCGLDPAKTQKLCVWLGKATGLREIHLDYNPLGSKGASQIICALKSNNTWSRQSIDGIKPKQQPCIDQLSMRFCGIEASGCHQISDFLRQNMVFFSLDLSGNNISSDGLLALCDGLSINTELQHLILGHNQIGMPYTSDEGETSAVNYHVPSAFDPLVDALLVNKELLHLNLQGNHFEDTTIYAKFLDVLKQRKALASKKIAKQLAITCSERGPTDVMVKIMDANKQAFTSHKKIKKKK